MSAPRFFVYGGQGQKGMARLARARISLLLECRGGPLHGELVGTAEAELARLDRGFPPAEPFYALDTGALPWTWVWTEWRRHPRAPR